MKYEALKIANAYSDHCVQEKKTKLYDRDWKEIANKVYKENVKPLHYIRCRRTMNQPEVKQLAENRIMQLLDEQGLTENKSSELIDKAVKIAEKQENAKILLDAAKYLNELRGLEPKKTVITESRQYNNADLSTIEGTISKELEAKRKITVSTKV